MTFISGHAHQVKTGLIVSLTDRIVIICSPKFIEVELLLPKETLIGNSYPGWLIGQTFLKRRKEFLEFSNHILEITEKRCFLFFAIYVPGLSEELKGILQNNS